MAAIIGGSGRLFFSNLRSRMQAKVATASPLRAEVAELADAQASGACGRKVVEVQILSSAPINFSGVFSADREVLANQ
jgi:hypothetical protein